MDLMNKIKVIYPELTDKDFIDGNVRVDNRHDGNGPYIAKWEHPTLAKPTDEQLAAVGE